MAKSGSIRREERVVGHTRRPAGRGKSALGEIVETAVLLDDEERLVAARLLRQLLDARRTPAAVAASSGPALQRARERGRLLAADILAGPDMLSADAMAQRLGVTRMTVNEWRKSGRLIGLAGAKRGYRFPAWQLDATGAPFGALPRLLELLDGSSWAVHRFATTPQPELDGTTGRDALAAGRSETVLQAAESVARATFV